MAKKKKNLQREKSLSSNISCITFKKGSIKLKRSIIVRAQGNGEVLALDQDAGVIFRITGSMGKIALALFDAKDGVSSEDLHQAFMGFREVERKGVAQRRSPRLNGKPLTLEQITQSITVMKKMGIVVDKTRSSRERVRKIMQAAVPTVGAILAVMTGSTLGGSNIAVANCGGLATCSAYCTFSGLHRCNKAHATNACNAADMVCTGGGGHFWYDVDNPPTCDAITTCYCCSAAHGASANNVTCATHAEAIS